MRSNGHSINAIADHLSIAKSTASLWVRHIALDSDQSAALRNNSHSPEAIEKRRQSRLTSERAKRNAIIEQAQQDIDEISYRELWLMGVMLYSAEGGKTQRIVRFSNGDPRMIRIMMRFFREVCLVSEEKLKGHIHIHEHLDVEAAEAYWSSVAGIQRTKFFKTYNKPNISSKSTRRTLPYGVMDIYILDVKLFLKLRGWAEKIFALTSSEDELKA